MPLSHRALALLAAAGLLVATACNEPKEEDPVVHPTTCPLETTCSDAGPKSVCGGSYDDRLEILVERCGAPGLVLTTLTCGASGLKAVRDVWPDNGTVSYFDAATGAPAGYVTIVGGREVSCAALAPGFTVPSDCVVTVADYCRVGAP